MDQLTSSISSSLLTGNYISAVLVAVIIPDICGKVEFKNKVYKRWFEANMPDIYREHIGGSDAFAIRCALLHSFNNNLTEHKARERLGKFEFTLDGSHLIALRDSNLNGVSVQNTVVISAKQYSEDLMAAYAQWLKKLDDDAKKMLALIDKDYIQFSNSGIISSIIRYS